MRILRLLVIPVVAVAALFVAPSAALAIPSGTGWSGSWEYTGGTGITTKVDVPGVKVVANGWDALGTRAFVVTVTDTSAGDGKCAYVKWFTPELTTEKWACGTSVQFLPPASTSTIVITACRDSAAHNSKTNCNPLDVPSSLADDFIRTPGNSFTWRYYVDPSDYEIEDWGAWLVLGNVHLDYFGVDDAPAGKRWILSWLTTLSSGSYCGSGKILYGDVPSSLTLCGANQINDLPTTTVTGTAYAQGCVWSQREQNPEKHCVKVRVPEPS